MCFPDEVALAAYVRRGAGRVDEQRAARVRDFVDRVHRQGMGEVAAAP